MGDPAAARLQIFSSTSEQLLVRGQACSSGRRGPRRKRSTKPPCPPAWVDAQWTIPLLNSTTQSRRRAPSGWHL